MKEKIKKIALPLLMLLSFNAFAQNPSQEEKKLLFDKIDTLLVNYTKYSRFLRGADLKISPEAIDDFKRLFVSDIVTLPDEMSPYFFDNQKGGSGKKPALPSGNPLKVEAGKLKGKVPVTPLKKTKSNAVLHSIKDSLTAYLTGLNRGRDSFYTVRNSLESKLDGYNEALDLQERIIDRTLAEFIVMVEANYQEGFSVKLLNTAIDLDDIENNNVKLLIRKRTEGKIYGSGVKLANTDTLMLTLQVSQRYSKVRISKIEMIGYKLDFLNDDDRDFINNVEDGCPEDRGLFSTTGCPEKEEANLKKNLAEYLDTRNTDSTTAFASLEQVDNKIRETENRVRILQNFINTRPRWVITVGANTGLVTADFTNSASDYRDNISSLEKNPNSTFSGGKVIGGFAMLERYFGTKDKPANIGIAVGLAFNSLLGTVKKDNFHVEYRGIDNNNNSFTQIISARNLEEKITISNVAVPIMAIYRGNVTKQLGFKIEGGVALNLFYKSSMRGTPTASFDYEAIYKYPSSFPGNGNYFDANGTANSDPTSWLITKDAATNIYKVNVEKYFLNLKERGYPVGLGLPIKETNGSATFNVGVSFILRPSISFYFGGSSLNVGAYFIQTRFSQSGAYQLINEKQQYNTLMQGVSKASNSSYGLHISYSIPLFYPFTKWTNELSGLR